MYLEGARNDNKMDLPGDVTPIFIAVSGKRILTFRKHNFLIRKANGQSPAAQRIVANINVSHRKYLTKILDSVSQLHSMIVEGFVLR